jgi:lipopolysaccharide biosynthesis glycosyltransferase
MDKQIERQMESCRVHKSRMIRDQIRAHARLDSKSKKYVGKSKPRSVLIDNIEKQMETCNLKESRRILKTIQAKKAKKKEVAKLKAKAKAPKNPDYQRRPIPVTKPRPQRTHTVDSGMHMNIVLCADENYIKHVPVVLNSIHKNNRNHTIDVYLLVRKCSKSSILNIEAYQSSLKNIKVITIDVTNKNAIKNYKTPLKHVSVATMDRLFIPSILSDLDRVLYLDVDLVVLKDLSQIYNIDAGGYGIAGKSSYNSSLIRTWCSRYNNQSSLNYNYNKNCNAGVLVMDLKTMRERAFQQFTVDMAEKYGVNDQIAINFYCRGEYAELPGEFNVYANNKLDISKYHANPGIVHYCSSKKPWDDSYSGSLKEHYLNYVI